MYTDKGFSRMCGKTICFFASLLLVYAAGCDYDHGYRMQTSYLLLSGGTRLAPGAVPLNEAVTFGIYGGSAGMTNQGIQTLISGNIGTTATVTTSITGFHDSGVDVYTETPLNIGSVIGTIYTCTDSTTGPTAGGVNLAYCAIATQALLDAQDAYDALVAKPAGLNPGGNLAGQTLAPGVYTAPAGSFLIQGDDLILDGGGNPDAVWVFQMSTTLTVGGPGVANPQSVILINGAQPKNIFWQVGTSATINAAGSGTMAGTIIANTAITFSTAGTPPVTILNGRAISLSAGVTMVNTVINVPTP